jgi:hypothetical protein
MAINQEKPINEMPKFLKMAIDRAIEVATDEEFEEAKKRLDKRKSEIVAGVVLHAQRMIQMDTVGEHLTITVKLD